MKRILLYLLLFYPHIAGAQLSEDSLKNICKELYKVDDSTLLRHLRQDGRHTEISAEELLRGYFIGIKAFMVNCFSSGRHSHDHVSTHKLYVLNSETGKQAEIDGIEGFNKLFTDSPKLCNLDKCYLYLFFVAKITDELDEITEPRDHRKVLSKNSVFLKDGVGFFSPICYVYSDCNSDNVVTIDKFRSQIQEDLFKSTSNNINIYALRKKDYCSCALTSVRRYKFTFDKQGEIEKVNKELLKLPGE